MIARRPGPSPNASCSAPCCPDQAPLPSSPLRPSPSSFTASPRLRSSVAGFRCKHSGLESDNSFLLVTILCRQHSYNLCFLHVCQHSYNLCSYVVLRNSILQSRSYVVRVPVKSKRARGKITRSTRVFCLHEGLPPWPRHPPSQIHPRRRGFAPGTWLVLEELSWVQFELYEGTGWIRVESTQSLNPESALQSERGQWSS